MYLSKEELKEKTNINIKEQLNKEKYKVEKQNPITLLTSKRFDLLAKYTYVKFKIEKIESEFGKELYLEHIKAFNNFFENDESQKVGKDDFLNSFDNLIDSVFKNGIDKQSIIPVSNNILLDGAHRTATAIYFNQSLNTVEINIDTPNYNYNFFKHRGLDEIYLDYMATTYIELKENIFTIILWPSSGGGKEKELQSILNKYGQIVYRKELKLKNYAPVHLVKQAYKRENWLGSAKDGYIGAQNKAKWCFSKDAPLRVIVFESDKDMIEMKDEIRRLYNIEKHAVHINDTKEEALELAGLLLNKNSIHWMNYASIKNFNWFSTLFNQYKLWIKNNNLNANIFCIDGSSTLAIYGIREARDLDYLYFGNESFKTGFKEIDSHNDELHFHPKDRDDIIFNPKNYFKVDNYKFISLDLIKEMKARRNEDKDKEDIKLINAKLEQKKIEINIKKYFNITFWKAKIKFILLRIRFHVTKFIQEKR